MSYPKEKCNNYECPYCESDKADDSGVCGYAYDIDDAICDLTIPTDCPWIDEYDKSATKDEIKKEY